MTSFTKDYLNNNLPCAAVVARHITESRTFDTDSLFAGTPVQTEPCYSSQLWLEKGVRMNILNELTGRVALNHSWMTRWDTIFDIAYNQAQFGGAA